ncbi:DUF1295 domain-containing protein [Leptospira sp. GIMC2001]|uniref:DUF1295 domain-containing protein n=1 Tax=Leptospira sp. GIMC2001 TaxID=1513297 RepID=UPI0023492279|nr:DUF1295 domain-containing protein [Leptospira sp. GIMC2001]WCL47624.1 DUF1295 domain-containing protein [Leptospira sp. GIMC2001]
MNILLEMVLPGFATSLFMMVLFWSWGRSRNNYGVIDVGWGLVIAAIVGVYAYLSDANLNARLLLFILVAIWGFRLAIFLFFTRIQPGHAEDKRYNAFRADYGDAVHRKFFTNVFLFQGLLALILTAPFLALFIYADSDPGCLAYAGVVLFIVGQLGETIADNQLSSFIKDKSNKGQVCKKGLWKYTRHPNYFFEWVIWVGLSMVAGSYHFIGFLPAILMYLLLVYFSGVPFAEKYSLQSKGDLFREYQRTTNAFFPWFPKS